MTRKADVIVIGAGVSGLTAAYSLQKLRPDLSVLVLEATDRIGGRTKSVSLKAKNNTEDRWDVGGQWVGEIQTDIMELLTELGLNTYSQYTEGKSIGVFGGEGKVEEFRGEISSSLTGGLDAWNLFRKLQNWAEKIDHLDPLSKHNKEMESWNEKSVEDFIDEGGWTKEGRETVQFVIESLMDAKPKDISVLFLLIFLKSAGGNFSLLMEEKDKGAQEFKIEHGTQSLVDKLAASIPKDCLLLNQPVAKVVQSPNYVSVESSSGQNYTGKRVVMAVPPILAANIDFSPPLMTEKKQLLQAFCPKGDGWKFVFTYPTAFWREKGYSGLIISHARMDPDTAEFLPTLATYDAVSAKGNPAIIGFSDLPLHLTPEKRRELLLKQISHCIGEEALDFLDFTDQSWGELPFSRGCVATLGPGLITDQFDSLLRQSTGAVHWAGTETATHWMGYMSGAVQAGKRAAGEVANVL